MERQNLVFTTIKTQLESAFQGSTLTHHKLRGAAPAWAPLWTCGPLASKSTRLRDCTALPAWQQGYTAVSLSSLPLSSPTSEDVCTRKPCHVSQRSLDLFAVLSVHSHEDVLPHLGQEALSYAANHGSHYSPVGSSGWCSL